MVCTTKPSMNLSFSGCGFLGLYHVGVVCAFKEHAPEVLQNPMAGCSAGSFVAACTMCGCCPGQMCSDALEIAIRARSRTLGPLHPTFNIVEIIRNGLRRILPPNAHEICSGRLFISLTRWKDNQNVIINKFHTREELIQVLICSSFVPFWSGLVPPTFRGEYHWDGGLTNNNPIIDERTIIVSPFAGESDICPRDESGSFYSVDFRGTDISCTQENLYRMTRALFPPNISVLKQVCWRGYIDGLKFLQTRNMINSLDLNPKTSISSVLGSEYTEPANEEEEELANGGIGQDIDQMYDDIKMIDEGSMDDDDDMRSGSDDGSAYHTDEESNGDTSQVTYSPFCQQVTRKKELPTSVFAVFATARQQEEDPIRRYFTDSRIYKVGSFMALPLTLPIDLTYAFTKRVLNTFRPSTTPPIERNLPQRAFHALWSFLDDPNEDKSCYHVHDCECTESRPSSIGPASARGPHRSRARPPNRRRRRQRHISHPNHQSNSVPMSTVTSTTSSRSDPTSDDEVMSIPDQSNRLPPPDLVASIKPSSLTQAYCHQLQQMAAFSNQKQAAHEQSSVTIPFFGQDDPKMHTERDPMPTTNLEKNVLFH